jgi:excisionase family DNA binding protein
VDEPRFLTLEQVAKELSTSEAQIYALVRRGELAAIRLGGRGQWRVERSKLEEFIDRLYRETQRYVKDNPLTVSED